MPALMFSAFVLIGNPLIVLVIMGVLGYRKRTSFLAGLTVAQISEFSLIFAGLGLAIGHINEDIVGLITLVGLITIGLSTYLILFSHQIYEFLSPALVIFQRKHTIREDKQHTDEIQIFDIIIIGMGRFGSKLAEILDEDSEINYIGVDSDPSVVRKWQSLGKKIVYGDMEDPELLEQPYILASKTIISTVADHDLSIQLMKSLKRNNYQGKVYLTALTEKSHRFLSKCGAEKVLKPHQMAASNFYNTYIKD